MSLIVRTLEKIDSLQRQLARDREDEAERAAEANGYGAAKQRFIQMIRDRADEEARRLYEEWKRDGPRSEEHTTELKSLMRNSYAVFCSKKQPNSTNEQQENIQM